MFISLIFAWISVLLAVLTALKFIARKTGNKKLNRFFFKIHMPIGKLLIATALIHGILAGNMPGSSFSEIMPASMLFTLNWGSACIIMILLLAGTFYLRKPLKKNWIRAHRVCTILFILFIVLHLMDTGIQIFDYIGSGSQNEISAETKAETTAAVQNETTAAAQTETTAAAQTETTAAAQAETTGAGQTETTAAAQAETTAAVQTETTASADVVKFSGAVLKDGTYEGSAQGFKGTITVSVTVEAGKVTGIEVVSHTDTPQYFSRADDVLTDIVGEQSLEVDTISGATFSSAGLINAAADALQNAVVSGELQVNEVDLSQIKSPRH